MMSDVQDPQSFSSAKAGQAKAQRANHVWQAQGQQLLHWSGIPWEYHGGIMGIYMFIVYIYIYIYIYIYMNHQKLGGLLPHYGI